MFFYLILTHIGNQPFKELVIDAVDKSVAGFAFDSIVEFGKHDRFWWFGRCLYVIEDLFFLRDVGVLAKQETFADFE